MLDAFASPTDAADAADRAGVALANLGLNTAAEDDAVLVDLIADLLHFADRAGLDREAIIDRAVAHHNAEVTK